MNRTFSTCKSLLIASRNVSRMDDTWLSVYRNCQVLTDWNESESDDTPVIDESATRLSPALLLSFTIALGLLITVGVIGNLLVIFALFRTRSHNATTTNAYILNLSIADLLFLVFCVPFQGTLYILNDWPFGNTMCKVAHYCQYLCMYASIWLLTTMSIDRYLAIGHPLQSVDWRSPGKATRICLCVWSASAVCSIPWLVLYSTKGYMTHGHANVTACFDYWSQGTYAYRKWLFLGVVMMGFVIPSGIIFCMAILVARSLRSATDQTLYTSQSAKRTESTGSTSGTGPSCARSDAGTITKRRRRVVYLVFALALVFVICWFPQNFTHVWQNFHTDILSSMRRHYRAYFVIKLISHILTYINSSINPILYSLASGQFRNRLAHALFNSGSYFHHTASNRVVRLGTLPACNNGHQGMADGANPFGRPKTGSFQPLLYTNNHSVADVDASNSRRSSRGISTNLAAPSPSRAPCDDETSFSGKNEQTHVHLSVNEKPQLST